MARPREFDVDKALDKAMNAFWLKGYEATSMSDLMEAMNLNKGSIYQTYGNKHKLFIRSLEKYTDDIFAVFNEVLTGANSPYRGLESLITEVLVEFAAGQKQRKGCFENNSLAELGSHDEDVRKVLLRQKKRIEKLLSQQITKAQKAKSIRDDIKADDLAAMMSIVISGIMTDCKAGRDKARTVSVSKTFLNSLTK